jgi:glyoxylate/hydroxypyruvate reductase
VHPTVVVASFLEPEFVERIRVSVPAARVLYDPELVAPPRYGADHSGRPDFRRNPEQEATFRRWLAEADVLYDVDRRIAPELPVLAPRLRWIQFTSSGIGELLRATGLDRTGIVMTNAAGIHAVPLAEHAILSMLYFTKDVPARLDDMRARRWERYCGRELRGRTVGIIGLGNVGREVARLSRALGLYVIGVRRSSVDDPGRHHADEVRPPAELDAVLPRCDVVVLILPRTPETERIMGPRQFELLPAGAILINIGRGALVDEQALLDALRSGRLAGAALDVASREPLPPDHPLWAEPRVLITAHSASTVDRENERLTDLFVDNLRRFVDGQPLRNVFPTPGAAVPAGGA